MLAIDRSTESLFVQTAIESSTKYYGHICTALFLRLAQLAFRRAGPQTTKSQLPNRHWISAISHRPDEPIQLWRSCPSDVRGQTGRNRITSCLSTTHEVTRLSILRAKAFSRQLCQSRV